MVAVVSSSGLGLFNSSLHLLGGGGSVGNAGEGRSGSRLYVNSATGNLIVQARDEGLSATGLDLALLRTYNSQGLLNDDNADNWRLGVHQRVFQLTGTVNTAGSTVMKAFGDGADVLYTYNTTLGYYVSKDGDGAHDSLAWNTGTSQWTWTDGSLRNTETYNSTGQLINTKDGDGNTFSYTYSGSLLTQIVDASGQTTYLDYNVGPNTLTQVRVVSNSVTQTLTRYTYDASNRLTQVRVDLSPGDNSVADNNVFLTTYTYDGTSKRIASIAQGSNTTAGSTVSFTYELVDGKHHLKTYTDGESKVTTFTYTASGATTLNANPAALTGVPAYYVVTAGQTWTNVTQAVYGSSVAAAVTALQNFMGNPTLSTGLQLYVPPTLTYGGTGISTQTDISTPLGLQTRIVSDTSGRITALLSPTVGGVRLETRYAYDADGNVTTITEDPTGANRVVTNAYDTSGNLTLTRDHIGNTVTRTYSTANQLVTETSYLVPDPDGAGAGQPGTPLTARYAYDAENHLRFAITAEGRVTEYRYNAAGTMSATIRYTGAKYDVSALTPTTVLTEAQLTTWIGTQDLTKLERTDFAYDFRGNVTTATAYAATDAAGAGLAAGASVTRYVYDQRGRLLSTIDPRGEATTGDPNDYATTYTYDGLGRVLTAVRWTPTGNVSTSVNAYNDATRVDTITLANGLITTTTYDRVGRVLTVAASTGLGTTTYVYDNDGRLRMTTNPVGVRTHNVYDAAGRKIFTVDGDGTLTEFIYDRLSNVVKTVEYAVAANTALVVDGGGVPIATVDVAALRTSANGQPTQNRISRAVYDAAHRVVFTIDAAGNLAKNFYDGASRITDTLQYATPVTISASIDELTLSGGGISGVTITTHADDRLSRAFYDNQGRTLGTLDGAGYLVKYAYNGAGELTQTTAFANLTQASLRTTGTLAQLEASITLDAAKDIVSYFFYDGQGRQIGVLDGERYLSRTVYDAAGNVAQLIRYPTQRTFAGTPTWAGILPADTNGAQITSYTYDEQGRVTQETNLEGTVTEYKYDNVGNLTKTTVALGTDPRVAQARYDALGRVTAELTPEGSVALAALGGSPTQPQIDNVWNQYAVKYAYDLAGRKISVTDQYSNVTLLFYDNDMRVRFTVRMVESAMGEVAELRYNALGQVTTKLAYVNRISTASLTGGDVTSTLTTRVTAAVDATKDSVTTYTYALTGHVATETTAEGGLITNIYNAFGELKTSTQLVEGAVSLEHRYTYDLRGLLTQTRWDPNAINATETRVYDAFGRLTSVTDPRGNVHASVYDKLGRTVQITDPLTKSSYSTYDAFSRVLTTTDRLNNVTQYAYNDTSRSVVVTTPESTQVTTVRNRHGQTATITDARGTVTTYEYDVNGQLKRVFDSIGNASQQTYDRAGRAVDTTDANGVITRLAYNAASRVFTRTVDPGGLNLVTTYTYDGRGQNISTTDERGVVTTTAFTRDGQVKTVTVQMGASPNAAVDLTTTFTYDKRGSLRVTTEGSGSSNPATTTYAYDVLGRRISETVVLGASQPDAVTQYKYDAEGNLTRKIDARGYSTWYVYDANDRLRWTIDALGGVTQNKYDDEGRVVETRRHNATVATGSFGDVVTSFSNPADAATDRVQQTVFDRDGRAAYSIDIVDTTQGASRGIVTQRYFDGNGNVIRTRMYANTIAWNAAPTMNSVATAVTPSQSLDRQTLTAYDIRNRATVDVDALGGVTRYEYDGNGNVVARTEYAATVPMDGAMRLWYVPSTNSSASRYVGNFATGDVVTATVRFKSPSDTSGRVFLGDAGGPNPYDNSIYSPVTYGNDGWQTITVSWTMTHADDVWIYIYGDRDGAYANATHNVLYDNVEVRSVQRGVVIDDRMDSISAWSISGNAQAETVTLSDAGSGTLVTSFATSLANSSRDRVTRSWYDAGGRQRFQLDAEGYVTETRYNDAGRYEESFRYLVKPVGVTGSSTTAQVATAVAAIVNANDRYAKTEYDKGGRVSKITDAYGNYEQFTYDQVGNKLTYRNEKGSNWTYTYDANHRLLTETTDAVSITSVTNVGGVLTPATASAGIVTKMTYDALGNVLTRTEAFGRPEARVTTYQYDQLGRQTRTIFPAVNYYNAAGDSATLAGSSVVRVELTNGAPDIVVTYNVFGDAVLNKDIAGSYQHKAYDRLGRVIYEADALNQVTEHRYDVFGNETSLIRYAGALNLATPAPALTQSNVWDATQIAAHLPVQASLDRTVTTQYDRLNRAIQVTQPSVHNFLPNVGSVAGGTTVTAGASTLYEYNAFGEVIRQRQLVGTASYADTYLYYDRRGLKTATVDPLGYLTTMEYGDGSRQLTRQIEYSSPIAWWNTYGYASPGAAPLTYAENAGDTVANGVTVVGDSAMKASGSNAWDSGFRSKVGYTGGAMVSWTVAQNNKYLMVGLNSDPMADNSYASLDYALYNANDGVVYVYENGTYIGSYGAYAKGDAFSVSYDGSNVRYARNGITFRTVAASIAGPLYADSSFHDVGGRVDNVEFQQGILADGVTFRAGTARKASGADGWNTAAFRSKVGYTGGATVAFTASQTDKYVMVGLNSDPASDLNYASLDYAIYINADGNVYVYESGTNAGNFGAYAAGDRFRVTYDGAKIKYLKNGTVFRELAATIATPLYADSSFYSLGGEVKEVEFGRSATDREVSYSYDRLDRVTAETRKIDGDGGLTRDSVTTAYAYDAVGNTTAVTDPLGGVTYTYYDILGRVTAVAQPARDVDGSATTTTLIPLTVMMRDAYGNLVQQVEYANGTASANATSYTAPTGSGADRNTLMLLDKYNRVLRTTDPEGNNREASYTIRGELAKEWQVVTNLNDSSVSAIVTIYQYDALGQQTAIVEPARLDSITQVATSTAVYNAFGEITSKAVTGTSRTEYFDYDQAGRVWRTNAGDGVDKVYLYDLQGNTTAEIRSQTVNLKTGIGSPAAALGLAGPDQMRTETRYDVLGRSVEQREVAFTIPASQEAITATFAFANLQVPVPSNAIYQQLSYYDPYQGTIVYYVANPAPYAQGGGYYQISAPSPSNPQGTYGRVSESEYSLLTRGYVTWNVPSEQGLTKHFYVRTGGGAWQEMSITQISPTLLGVDVSGLPSATWEYQLTYTRAGDTNPYAMATGTIALTNTGTTTMTAASGSAVGGVSLVSTSVSGTNVTFRWNGVYDGGITPLLEVKPTSSGTWQTVTGSLVSGALQATVTGVPVGTAYDYRITHLRNGLTEAMGVGTMQVSASYSTTTGTAYANPGTPSVPPLTSYTYSDSPNTDIAFYWSAPGGSEYFYYRPAGGSWVSVGSANGYNAWIGSLPPGNYEWQHGWQYTDGYTTYGGDSSGTFVVNGTSSYMTTTYNNGDVGMNFYQNTPTPNVYTVIYWAIEPGIPGTPQFLYRPVGGSWVSAPVYDNGAGSYYIVAANLGGNYEHQVNFYVYDPGNPPYTPPTNTLTAQGTGTFWVSGTSTAVTSQGGTPGPLPGVYSSGTNLYWSRPANGDTVAVTLNGTPYTPITSDNVNYYISFNGLPTAWYNYEISYTKSTGWKHIVGSGGISVTTTVTPAMANPSSPAGVSLVSGFYDAGNRRLAWTTAANGGSSVTFRYRVTGSGSWSTLTPFAYGGAYAVDLPIGVSGPYEYEVQYTNSGAPSPYAIGKGTVSVVNNVTSSASVTDTTSTTLAPIAVTPRLQQKFDRWGNIIEAIDAALQATNNRYNQYGQVVEVTSPRTAVLSTVGGVTDTSTRPAQRNYYDQLGRLVATRDGNNNINRSTLNAGGQALVETHADGGVQTSVYDIFGQKIQVTDELGYRARMTYNRTGNMTAQAHEIVAGGFAGASPSDLTPIDGNAVLQNDYVYDGAGRRTSESSGANMPGTSTPEVTRYWYDLRGNVTRRRSPGTHNGSGLYETTYEYDLLENKTRETNANGHSLQWAYDGFGRATSQIDMGGTTTTLAYDAESKLLVSQTNTLGQNIGYTYDAAGHLTRILENSAAGGGLAGVQRDTTYSYDAAGRRARERVVVDGLVHQDTHIAYDELGRMSQLSDLRYRTTYRYDGAGNRTRILSTYYDHAGVQRSDDLWYTYDAMNRVKVSQGVNSSGTVTINGAQGIELAYDLKGQRTSAIQYGQKFALTQAWSYADPYNPQQTFFYSFTSGASTEQYGYDGLGRLLTTDRSLYATYQPGPYSGYTYSEETMMQSDTRTYDKAGRELTSSSAEIEGNALITRSRTTNYDDSGRILNQTTSKNGVKESFVIYGDSYYEEPGEYWYYDPFTGQPVSYTWGGSYTPGFDAAGVLRSYLVRVYNTSTPNPDDIAYTSTYFLSYREGTTYQDTGTTVTSTSGGPQSGSTSRSYNVNGELIATGDSRDPSRNRYFANDATGQTITAVQGQFDGAGGHWTHVQAFANALANIGGYNTTKSQHFFSALGQSVGSFGQLSEGGTFKANFDVNFTPISDHYPASTPSEVVVQKGDTLRIVAARIWGDSNLWYLLAEENGVTSPDVQLEAGMALRVPNEVVSMRNDAGSFKPFDVREVIGDTTPTQPAPPAPKPKKKGCGVLGQILVIVVAVVVTYFTAGAAGFHMAAWAAGMLGAAAGSVASQLVGIAVGVQDKFSWKAVAAAAASGAIGGALSKASGFSEAAGAADKVGRQMWQAAANNAINQGVNIAFGLQEKFNWASVAASAVSAPIANKVGKKVTVAMESRGASAFAMRMTGSLAQGAVNQATYAAFTGGRINYAQLIGDAFGNALGNAFADRIGTPKELRELSREQRRHVRNLAERVGADIHDPNALRILIEASEMSHSGNEYSRQTVIDRTRAYLGLGDATSEQIDAVIREYSDHGILPPREGIVTVEEDFRFAESRVPTQDDGLSEIVVDAQRIEPSPAFGSHYIDQGLMGAGELFTEIGAKINDHPILKWTLVGMDVAAGPIVFAARTAIDKSPIGDFKRAAETRVADFASERLEGAGNDAQSAEYGGGGAVGLVELALGGAIAGLRKATRVFDNFAQRAVLRERLGIAKGSDYRAHHLIPVAEARASRAVRHAIGEGVYDINRLENGIALPGTVNKALETGELLHRGPHRDYSRLVRRDLQDLDRDFLARRLTNEQVVARITAIEVKYRGMIEEGAVRLSRQDPNFPGN